MPDFNPAGYNSTISLDDLAIVLAAQTILTASVLPNAKGVPQTAAKVLHTYNSPNNAQTIINQILPGPYGTRLVTVSVSVDAIFQTNYNWFPAISGVMDDSTSLNYQPFDPTVNVFDAVPTSKSFLLPPGASVHIKAFNAISTNTTDGFMSVYISYSPLTAAEAAVLQKYSVILKKMAGV